jgi:small subunit ribosomal protein S4e
MHTKSIAIGGRKGMKWTATARGAHKKAESIPLVKIIRDELKLADNSREANRIIVSGQVQVDGKTRKQKNLGVGLMDVVSIPKIGKNYRILSEKNGLKVKEITAKDAKVKICKVIGKKVLPKGKIQVNLHDGGNILTAEKIQVNDSVVIELPSKKIKEVIPYGEGKQAIVVKGAHTGASGPIKEIIPGSMARKSQTIIGEIQTLTDYVFVTGKDKQVIEL